MDSIHPAWESPQTGAMIPCNLLTLNFSIAQSLDLAAIFRIMWFKCLSCNNWTLASFASSSAWNDYTRSFLFLPYLWSAQPWPCILLRLLGIFLLPMSFFPPQHKNYKGVNEHLSTQRSQPCTCILFLTRPESSSKEKKEKNCSGGSQIKPLCSSKLEGSNSSPPQPYPVSSFWSYY